MNFELQSVLENELIKLIPLKKEDFETLYQVASDPLIWEQHPDRYRYKREIFEKYFEGAMKSGGAFLVINNKTGEVIGSSRFYDYDKNKKSIAIGYTFIARKFWGTACNRAMKNLMLDHAFKFVEKIIFHIGEKNFRSQKAIEKLGARKMSEAEISMPIENEHSRFIYVLDFSAWQQFKNNL